MNNQKNNLIWINHIKCFCMVLVYLYHTETYYNCPLNVITNLYEPFFVNLFFIVSGYLLFRKYLTPPNDITSNDQINQIREKYFSNIFFRLILPTIIFSLINYFPKKILREQSIDISSLFMDSIGGGSLWFTSALVIAQILIFIGFLFKSNKIVTYIIYAILLSILANILASHTIFGSLTFPWYYKAGMHAVLFMVIGGGYWKYENVINRFINHNKWLLYIIIFIYIVIVTTFNKDLEYNISTGRLNFYGIICAISASLIIIYIAKSLNASKITDFVGRNSIVFYFLSGGIPNVISIITLKLGLHSKGLIIILTIISFITAYFVVKILTKHLSFLLDLRKIK